MIEFDALKSFFRAALDCESITNLNVMLEIAINLYTPIYNLAYDLYLLAIALRSPGISGRLRYIAFPNEVVKPVRIVSKDIAAAYES
jgi:hypothetical protein